MTDILTCAKQRFILAHLHMDAICIMAVTPLIMHEIYRLFMKLAQRGGILLTICRYQGR